MPSSWTNQSKENAMCLSGVKPRSSKRNVWHCKPRSGPHRSKRSLAVESSEARICSDRRASSTPPCPSLHWLRWLRVTLCSVSCPADDKLLEARLASVYERGDTAEEISSTQ
ncbi:hypothetical protein PHBOTO_004373 [Pseudozyma hubeiensis]|nr:hypothetical protein PHBOTO_004373 [Pseudozyma hubeiensis]